LLDDLKKSIRRASLSAEKSLQASQSRMQKFFAHAKLAFRQHKALVIRIEISLAVLITAGISWQLAPKRDITAQAQPPKSVQMPAPQNLPTETAPTPDPGKPVEAAPPLDNQNLKPIEASSAPVQEPAADAAVKLRKPHRFWFLKW